MERLAQLLDDLDDLFFMVGLVSERIRSCIRDQDIAARLGGDEFAILVADQPTLAHSISIAERLIDVMAAAFPVQRHEAVVGVSVGIEMVFGKIVL